MAGFPNARVYLTDAHKQSGPEYAQTANKEFEFFGETFGESSTRLLNVVELPDDTLPAYWAPEIAAIAGARIADRNHFRLLANTMAHQWWGCMVTPATLNDAWITNGMSRYGELMYVERISGQAALQAARAGYLCRRPGLRHHPAHLGRTPGSVFPSIPVHDPGEGRHGLPHASLGVGRRQLSQDAAGHQSRSTRTNRSAPGTWKRSPRSSLNCNSPPFFAQWLDGTGAPQFLDKYTVYRLGNNKGFRTIGEIGQDLDLFNMPVELRVETEGKTEMKRVDVVGTDSQYVVDTFGRPRHIAIDPDNWVLKNSPDLQVRVSILRGQQLVAEGDTTGALAEYQKALTANPNSSLASYRIGEVLFNQRNYQAAANAYRDALRGDDEPKWTEVWSHIALGKIFDVTGQRDRAVNEYRQAVQTNDNTQGAVNEARRYLEKPYKRPDTE